jgi:hypothetical protein
MAALAELVSVALAAARRGRGAAPSTHALVAALHSSSLLAGRVIEVGLDGGFRATETSGDLSDREALLVAVVARKRRSPAPFMHTITGEHRWRRYRSQPMATERAGWSPVVPPGRPSSTSVSERDEPHKQPATPGRGALSAPYLQLADARVRRVRGASLDRGGPGRRWTQLMAGRRHPGDRERLARVAALLAALPQPPGAGLFRASR